MKIALKNITKSYPLKTALAEATVAFESGKIHALLGENGAGKTTLASIVSGNLAPTSGELFIDGEKVSFKSPKDAISRKIIHVHQTPKLAESITAEENIILASYFQAESKKSMEKNWKPMFLSPKELKTKVKDLGGNKRFYISLESALLNSPKCLILDEPSAFLDQDERKSLYAHLKELAAGNTTIIVITHSVSEATSYADTITLLNEGKVLKQFNSAEEYEKHGEKPQPSDSETAEKHDFNGNSSIEPSQCLKATSLSCRPKNSPMLQDATFECSYGQITAITGLHEASLSTLENVLTGMETAPVAGSIEIQTALSRTILKNKRINPQNLRNLKVAIIPSDKTKRGSNPELTISQAVSSVAKTPVEEIIRRAELSVSPKQKTRELSGGMLQRLILQRELSTDPNLIILCNPMQGLDSLSQSKLCRLLTALAEENKAILILGAADFPLTLCSKVYALEDGRTAEVFSKQQKVQKK